MERKQNKTINKLQESLCRMIVLWRGVPQFIDLNYWGELKPWNTFPITLERILNTSKTFIGDVRIWWIIILQTTLFITHAPISC